MILQVHNREKFIRNYFKLPEEAWEELVDRQNTQTSVGKGINYFLSGYQEQEEKCFRKHFLEAEKVHPDISLSGHMKNKDAASLKHS